MTRQLLATLLLVACARSVSAQIARDACIDGGSTTGTSLTFAHTVAATATVLLVAVKADTASDVFASGTVTWDTTQTLTRVDMGGADISARRIYLFLVASPHSGTHNVVLTPSASSFLWGIAGSYKATGTSADAKTTNGNSNASGTSLATSVTTVADNDWTILAGSDPQGVSAGTGSSLWCGAGSFGLFDSNGALTPPGSKSMTITGTPADNIYAVMLALAPASTGSGRLTLLGVGQ